jgi:hypothetical protein
MPFLVSNTKAGILETLFQGFEAIELVLNFGGKASHGAESSPIPQK